MNPTKYTLQAEDVDDTSHADEIEEASAFEQPKPEKKDNSDKDAPVKSEKLRDNIKIGFRDRR